MIVELRVVATEGVAEVSDAVSQIYREVYAEPLFLKFPRKFREDFSVRFRESAQQPGFEVILAISEIGYVGFIYGYTLTDPADWWRTVRLLKREDNARARKDFALWGDSISTVVIPQLLVRKGWRGVGIGRRLHDTFLVRRTEDLAALRVLPSNVAAKSAYQAWGWTTYGILEGLCGSPDLECMAKPLR